MLNKTKLNVGGGAIHIPGFLQVDRKTGGEAYPLKCNGRDVEDGSVAEIRASHILEHFGHHETLPVLQEWVRVLEPGGVLKVAVPDAQYCIDAYNKGTKTPHPIEAYLFGGQQDAGDFHKSMFNRGKLEAAMKAAGLFGIEPWKSDLNDCAAMDVSLNLQGYKPHPATAAKPLPPIEQAREDLTPEEFLSQNLLGGYASNIYSQGGEDGIIAEIFRRIGTTTKHCFEVGADDGIRFSNTRRLIGDGWSSTQIEADPANFAKLQARHAGNPRVQCVNAIVNDATASSLDEVLRAAGAPADIDLGIIDIDGQDYYTFLGMIRYRPRVMVVEFNHMEADPGFIPERDGGGQAGIKAIAEAGLAKGYLPVARTLCNLIFVRRELCERLMHEPFTETTAEPTKPTASALPGVAAVLSMPRYAFTQQVTCLLELAQQLRVPTYIRQGVFWHSTLEAAIELALKAGAEYILTIDIDTIFKAEQVAELYRLMQAHPDCAAICGTQVGRDRDEALLTVRDSTDPAKNARQIERSHYDGEVMQLATGHFGLTLIRASAFRAIAKPWFLAVPAADGGWGEGRVDADIYWWQQMEKAGLKLYQANKVRLGHWQDVCTLPDDNLQPVHVYAPDFRAGKIPASAKW